MRTSMLMVAGLVGAMNSEAAGQVEGRHSAGTSVSAATGQNMPAYASNDCDYNTCALRTKLSWGNLVILQGEQEKQIAKLGMFRAPSIESIVATSPQAVTEARTFRNNYGPGEVLQFVGVLLMGAGVASASENHSALIPVTAVLGGAAVLFYGVSRRVRAFNALSKTIWLYNRSLQR